MKDKTMKKMSGIIVLLATILCVSEVSFAQDSLHLVATITGESFEKRITNAVGVGDVNGDGYDDFAVSMPNANQMRLYLGGPKFDTSRYVTFAMRDSLVAMFGGAIAGAGDVNGDGYGDILISAVFNSGGLRKGIVYLYLGGKEIATTPAFSFYDKNSSQDMLGSISGAGDVNGDGYDDFLIGEPYNWSDAIGKAYLFLGGKTLPTEPAVTFVSDSVEDFFGYSVRGIGDVNGDGFNDIAVGATASLQTDRDPGRVCVYLGGKTISNVPTVLNPIEGDIEFGNDIEKAGDINGDGHGDFIVTSERRAYIYLGLDSVICIAGSQMGFGGYVSVGAGGDMNNDRYDDFMIGNTNHRNADSVMVGAACVYLGGTTIDTIPKFYVEGETKWSGFGYRISLYRGPQCGWLCRCCDFSTDLSGHKRHRAISTWQSLYLLIREDRCDS
ncbi:MAG: FG-GAP-like repeat-containing protein [Bacteroidetes bacterium]|nr:FG-GAP-like repeat-containing protein [Bacteroidota bacterium]MCL5738757.1 FG-GAP-like repeat-containing protein [Bacteroidota bacterium]